ncbi:MAG: ribonuclease PH [Candidatus Limnocylindrus sp.]|jgi:ribonuclease PH
MSIGSASGPRGDGRAPDQMRALSAELGVQKWAEGSAIITVGNTVVICSASVEDRVPPHLRGKGTGWITAEYSMLPRATNTRSDREAVRGKLGGRTHEIQRLIGRSLRQAVDLTKLGERSILIDCDVLVADGGTRCASITGGWIALALAMRAKKLDQHLTRNIAAISVGVVDGRPVLDLPYEEDSRAEVDLNVVATESGHYVELQGTAEQEPFHRDALDAMLKLADKGIAELINFQRATVDGAR